MKKANQNSPVARLIQVGISQIDALELRRISMTLHRWHELECGDGDNAGSWCITRGQMTKDGFVYNDNGAPYMERHWHSDNKARYTRIPDRERGAMQRLTDIISRYDGLGYYIQSDPRGAALYIIRPGDIPATANVDSCYSNGIAVYK